MAGAEGAVVSDAHLGGLPLTVTLLGIESRLLRPIGSWPPTSPAAADPRVVRATSGLDGSPPLRTLQVEYGAEIGRAVVNFRRPDRRLRRVVTTEEPSVSRAR